ncbi:urease accessory protein UreF [Nocardioides sp. R-C-SC26]|uniref:urease accessory protein UreF n=1 Tax=Nocardioides sp. R-C-SC26 TaxID=2870414 RepID=UPI001E4239B3|nr:urease accessory UreF family protein [Nocardioides sp. R-C-SC26]
MHAHADSLLLLLADARLPVAGHTQSGTLEPALAGGLTVDDVPFFVATRLRTVTRVEAATAVVALHRIRSGLKLDDVERAWAARTPSPAMRATSRTQARALLRLTSRLWPAPAPPVVELVETPHLDRLEDRRPTSRAVALAHAADRAGLSPRSLARLVAYDDVQTVCAAALKLVPLDPAVVTGWVFDALPLVDRLADEVAGLQLPHQIPASGAPQIEAWAQAHATATRRLFSA